MVLKASANALPDDLGSAAGWVGANGYIPKATTNEDLVEVMTAIKSYWLRVNCAVSNSGH